MGRKLSMIDYSRVGEKRETIPRVGSGARWIYGIQLIDSGLAEQGKMTMLYSRMPCRGNLEVRAVFGQCGRWRSSRGSYCRIFRVEIESTNDTGDVLSSRGVGDSERIVGNRKNWCCKCLVGKAGGGREEGIPHRS